MQIMGKDDGFDEVHINPDSGLCTISMRTGIELTWVWRILHDGFSSV